MFPDLPEDIGRLVFELAAETTAGPHYALVSRKVQSWVEPIIYRSIILAGPATTSLLYRTIADPNTRKTAEFFAQHVKFLTVRTWDYPEVEMQTILRACRGVKVLTNWGTFYPTCRAFQTVFSSSYLSPSRLSILGDSLLPQEHWRMDFSLPVFQNLTHLEVRRIAAEGPWNKWDGLSLLGNLTHFSVTTRSLPPPDVEWVKGILARCPATLRIFIICIPFNSISRGGLGEFPLINKGDADLRAVLAVKFWTRQDLQRDYPHSHFEYALPRARYEEHLRDWVGRTAGKDFWELAEEVVERRREWLQKTHSAPPA
ncbi:hypothetical protein H1R20_g7959, partial [Candolleomyces eurysporus]